MTTSERALINAYRSGNLKALTEVCAQRQDEINGAAAPVADATRTTLQVMGALADINIIEVGATDLVEVYDAVFAAVGGVQ